MGTARRLRAYNPDVKIVALQPDSPFHGLEGLKHMPTAIKPGIYEEQLADINLNISTDESYAMLRRLAREEGLLVGLSSGTAMVGALKIAKQAAARASAANPVTIVTLFPDNAVKYLASHSDIYIG